MKIKHKRSGGMREWMVEHVFLLVVIPCSLLIIASGVVSAMTLINMDKDEPAEEEVEPEPEAPQPIVKYFSHLTGGELADQAALTSAATCVMIENSPNARPQSGLRNAGIVYEAIAEGGITRFMAIYQNNMPELVGPVRSLRLYYAHWAKPYQCSIAHVGGAGDVLPLVRNPANGYRDIDQFFNGGSYWRAADRYAPHNVYTNAEKMNALNAAKGYTSSNFAGFERAVADAVPTRSETKVNNIGLTISSALWNVSYAYDAASNTYLRAHVSGGAHMDKDASGALIQNAPKVVVAIMVDQVARGGGYSNVVTTGSGAAHVFQNGEYISGTWSRGSIDEELKIRDAEGNDIVFNRGQIWISAVPKNNAVNME